MTREKEYFIHLLAGFLNGEAPKPMAVDWTKIFELADKHSVQAIVSQQIKSLPAEAAPQGKLKSMFNQQIGRTIQAYDKRLEAIAVLESFFCDSKTDYMFVKGACISRYYPVPEYRTGGDIDVIVRDIDFGSVVRLLRNQWQVKDNSNVAVLTVNDVEVEVHSACSIRGQYFDDIFALAEQIEEHKYQLGMYHQLLYVLRHIGKHLSHSGAGVRMLMDVDVLVRAIPDFDNQVFTDMCMHADCQKIWNTISSLVHLWFATPVDWDRQVVTDSVLMSKLERVFLDGGVFGLSQFDLGDYYITKSLGTGQQVTVGTRARAVLRFIFPGTAVLCNQFGYAKKHKFLLPVAFCHRLFLGVFARFGHSKNTLNAILRNDSDISVVHRDLLQELGITE